MDIEKQVCSLELSQRLEELGVNEECYFKWVFKYGTWSVWNPTQHSDYETGGEKFLRTYTVAELGQMLPPKYRTYRNGESWYYGVHQKEFRSNPFGCEADARAAALIWCRENKLV